MKLIVGLGNPGKQYEKTRHNMGFLALDRFAEKIGCDLDRHDFNGEYGIYKNPRFAEPLLLLKPMTFMNASGNAVNPIVQYFDIDLKDIIVIYDDMAIEPGALRLREGGSSGGHKGMQSIIEQLGTDDIARLRIGIGEPQYHDPIDYVLGKPQPEEQEKINDALNESVGALIMILTEGFQKAMSTYNKKTGKENT